MTHRSVLIAPDSFKGSLTATEAANAIATGWSSVRPLDTVEVVPLADGGEGTLDAIEAAVAGAERRDVGMVTGPDGTPVGGQWLSLPDGTGVIELAQCSGLPLMAVLDPLGATTFGLGQVIAAALQAGAHRLVIGLGGSASTDAGAGALAALGLGSATGSLRRGGAGLAAVTGIDRSGLTPAPTGGVILLTDVRAPLLGPDGAAAVFAPQKGATPDQVALLEDALTRFSSELGGTSTAPGSGAAGGTAFGLSAAWGASISPGAEFISALCGMPESAPRADVVLTGEGRFDATSLSGKLVGHVLDLATGSIMGVIAGEVGAAPLGPDGRPIWSRSLVTLAGSTAAAMGEAQHWLAVAGADAARELAR